MNKRPQHNADELIRLTLRARLMLMFPSWSSSKTSTMRCSLVSLGTFCRRRMASSISLMLTMLSLRREDHVQWWPAQQSTNHTHSYAAHHDSIAFTLNIMSNRMKHCTQSKKQRGKNPLQAGTACGRSQSSDLNGGSTVLSTLTGLKGGSTVPSTVTVLQGGFIVLSTVLGLNGGSTVLSTVRVKRLHCTIHCYRVKWGFHCTIHCYRVKWGFHCTIHCYWVKWGFHCTIHCYRVKWGFHCTIHCYRVKRGFHCTTHHYRVKRGFHCTTHH